MVTDAVPVFIPPNTAKALVSWYFLRALLLRMSTPDSPAAAHKDARAGGMQHSSVVPSVAEAAIKCPHPPPPGSPRPRSAIFFRQQIFTPAAMPDVIAMVKANICRALPPQPDDCDPDKDEPLLEEAWPHLQVREDRLLLLLLLCLQLVLMRYAMCDCCRAMGLL